MMALVMGAAMGSWLLFMYKSHRVNTQASLDMDVRMVIERFRTEMRNTARESIIFYPENEPYSAVGFALAADQDGDGLKVELVGIETQYHQINEYDITDANFLLEATHTHLSSLVKDVLRERKIDQEVDFSIVRESRQKLIEASPSAANGSRRRFFRKS